MKERPILFSGEMVKAILNGTKRQTRRVIQPQPIESNGWFEWGYSIGASKVSAPKSCTWHAETCHKEVGTAPIDRYCPYGQKGDRLWVRESMYMDKDGVWLYSADDDFVGCDRDDELAMISWAHHKETEHCPSIHMPRWASRIMLEITNVRAERLHDISEADAKAEGVGAWHDTKDGTVYRPEFGLLWDSINGRKGFTWNSNPFVWVISFRRIE